MFTKKVTDDDSFMALSSSAQALYLHLTMSADDDGFTNQVALSMFRAHASVQDLEALMNSKYIYQFESGVVVISDWRMANALRKDRHNATVFQKELEQLQLNENGRYEKRLPDGCRMVAGWLPQDRLDKDRVDKNNNPPYIPPTETEKMIENSEISDEVKKMLPEWLTYKKEQFKFEYKPTGFKQFLTEVKNVENDIGTEMVLKAISLSMAKGYKGIIWDLVKTKNQNGSGSAYMDAIKNRVSVVDSWTIQGEEDDG